MDTQTKTSLLHKMAIETFFVRDSEKRKKQRGRKSKAKGISDRIRRSFVSRQTRTQSLLSLSLSLSLSSFLVPSTPLISSWSAVSMDKISLPSSLWAVVLTRRFILLFSSSLLSFSLIFLFASLGFSSQGFL